MCCEMSAIEQFDRPLPRIARLLLVAEILGFYCWVQIWVRRRRLPTLAAQLRTPVGPALAAPAHPAAPYRLAWAVERVLKPLPSDSRCLVNSLVLVGLLARRSLASRLVIGVREGGEFGAHAWVEYEGKPLLSAETTAYGRIAEV